MMKVSDLHEKISNPELVELEVTVFCGTADLTLVDAVASVAYKHLIDVRIRP